jgi:UPF0176 protein
MFCYKSSLNSSGFTFRLAKKENTMSKYVVSALYHFAKLDDYEECRAPLLENMKKNNVKGTLLLAAEGINGTVASTREGIDSLLSYIRSDERLAKVVTKESYSDVIPFYRSKVKLKKEIVTMGVEGIDPTHIVGTYIKPADWNDLISDPDVVLVDTRNDYEVSIGTFKNALNPNTTTFREFPEYVKDNLEGAKKKKVAMYCTGGIRCEKSTAYLKQQGFDEVYHLEGGILKYLEEVPEEKSLWEGECFVFDSRVAVKHGLAQGKYDQCFACRMPITEEEKASQFYVKGISCHNCHDEHTDAQKRSHAERQKQIAIAAAKGQDHIGGEMFDIITARRAEKLERKQRGLDI